MITVKLYGFYRLDAEKPLYQFESAKDVNAVLELLAKETRLTLDDWKNAIIYVNDTAIDKLNLFRTKVKDGDVLSVLSPASGG